MWSCGSGGRPGRTTHDLFLLTSKPVLYVCNVDEGSVKTGNAYVEQVREAIKDENAQLLVIAAKTESEIAELESYEDRQMFLEELGLEESGMKQIRFLKFPRESKWWKML